MTLCFETYIWYAYAVTKFGVLKMRICAGYRHVRVICAKIRYRLETRGMRATVLTVETRKQTTGLLVSAPMLK